MNPALIAGEGEIDPDLTVLKNEALQAAERALPKTVADALRKADVSATRLRDLVDKHAVVLSWLNRSLQDVGARRYRWPLEGKAARKALAPGQLAVSGTAGLHADIEEWVQRLAPGPAPDDRAAGPAYRHHRIGEDNGDAHLKNLLIGHQVIVPVTEGKLDLGPWQQIFYFEFDARRPKRLVLKAIGE